MGSNQDTNRVLIIGAGQFHHLLFLNLLPPNSIRFSMCAACSFAVDARWTLQLTRESGNRSRRTADCSSPEEGTSSDTYRPRCVRSCLAGMYPRRRRRRPLFRNDNIAATLTGFRTPGRNRVHRLRAGCHPPRATARLELWHLLGSISPGRMSAAGPDGPGAVVPGGLARAHGERCHAHLQRRDRREDHRPASSVQSALETEKVPQTHLHRPRHQGMSQTG